MEAGWGSTQTWAICFRLPSVEVAFPVARHLARRTRDRLIKRVVLWRREPRTLQHVVSFVVIKPILTRLKAAD